MYQYRFETLGTGGGAFSNNIDCAHREIIEKHAADGWRFVGFVPTCFTSHGGISQVDLVFEKEVV